MLGTILLIIVILMLLGAMPTWPHSRGWGYYPNGGLGLIILLLLGRIETASKRINTSIKNIKEVNCG
jgi:hypothetical protein